MDWSTFFALLSDFSHNTPTSFLIDLPSVSAKSEMSISADSSPLSRIGGRDILSNVHFK